MPNRIAALPIPLVSFLALFSWIVLALPAAADSPRLIGKYVDWDAFSGFEDGKLVCYMATKPKDMKPKNVNRGEVYMMVTYRPAANVDGEVSIYTGYTYEDESKVDVTIGDDPFVLFTYEDTAWARDKAGDKALVRAMIKGTKMTAKGVSNRETTTIDTYSLRGFTAANKAVRKACKI